MIGCPTLQLCTTVALFVNVHAIPILPLSSSAFTSAAHLADTLFNAWRASSASRTADSVLYSSKISEIDASGNQRSAVHYPCLHIRCSFATPEHLPCPLPTNNDDGMVVMPTTTIKNKANNRGDDIISCQNTGKSVTYAAVFPRPKASASAKRRLATS